MKTNSERQKAMRLRRARIGQRRREYFLTDSEAGSVADFISQLRKRREQTAPPD